MVILQFEDEWSEKSPSPPMEHAINYKLRNANTSGVFSMSIKERKKKNNKVPTLCTSIEKKISIGSPGGYHIDFFSSEHKWKLDTDSW